MSAESITAPVPLPRETTAGAATTATRSEASAIDATRKEELAWYTDPSKLVGVLGFVLALGTLGERCAVRSSELTAERLQDLRNVTGQLADIQSDFLEAVEKNPGNLYQLGTAKNTKRQMLLQTADALLDYDAVRRGASAQIYGALASEAMSDGRYDHARQYFERALTAPGADESLTPFILRSLGMLYRVPNTPISNTQTAASYFARARAIFGRRADDAGQLSWAETVLTEGNLELTYGNADYAKQLATQAQERLQSVKMVSPARTQLLRWAAALEHGEHFAQGPGVSPPAAQ
jgi:tetratricopeptide (TPR) repeat protein